MPERPDFERVLAEHVSHGGAWGGTTPGWTADCLGCDWTARGTAGGLPSAMTAHRAHLAAALNAEVTRWLADEDMRERVADAFSHTGVNRPQGFTVPEWRTELATAALAALAPTDTTDDEKGAGR